MIELIKASFLLNIKEMRNIILMVLLPIFLTLILGVSLSSVFNENNSNVLSESTWIFEIEDSDSGEQFTEFIDIYQEQFNISIVEERDKTVALDKVSQMDVDGYLVFQDDEITIYTNEHSSESVKWIEIIFNNYLVRASIINEVVTTTADMELLKFIDDNSMDIGNHVDLLQIDSMQQPSAIGYYAVAMITLTSCYSMIVLILGLNEEKKKNTLKRYLLSGKSFFSFLFSKSLSISLLLLVQILVVMLFDTFVYRVDFGNVQCWLTVLFTSFVFSLVVTQFGITLTMIFKNLTALNIVINAVFLPIILFFGGAYLHFYKLISIGLQDIIVFSPVYHINKGLFDAIYLNSYDYIMKFTCIAIIICIILVGINIILAKRRGNSWVQ